MSAARCKNDTMGSVSGLKWSLRPESFDGARVEAAYSLLQRSITALKRKPRFGAF
jgi:hypothetical protein